jgi:hypothetical protein
VVWTWSCLVGRIYDMDVDIVGYGGGGYVDSGLGY